MSQTRAPRGVAFASLRQVVDAPPLALKIHVCLKTKGLKWNCTS